MTRLALVLVLCAAVTAEARPRARRRLVVAAAEKTDLKGPTGALLARAAALYASSDFGEVLQLGRELEKRHDLTLEQRLEAYRLLGSALAIVEDPLDAEPVARRLYNLRPDYELPKGTPAKIVNAFTKAQREVKEALEQAERARRLEQISRMKLLDPLPQGATGGLPLSFAFRLQDPDSLVEKVVVHYRRAGQGAYSSLALERDRTGQWAGQIPAEQTADPTGFVLEHWVETGDAKGPLLVAGGELQPLRLSVSAGDLPKPREKKPLSRGPFFTALGATLLSGGVAVGFGAGWAITNSEQHSPMSIAGTTVNALSARGSDYSVSTVTAVSIAAALAVTTLVLFFLTEWEP